MSRRVLCTCDLDRAEQVGVGQEVGKPAVSGASRLSTACISDYESEGGLYVSSCFVYVRSVPFLRAVCFRPTVIAGRLGRPGAAVGEFQRGVDTRGRRDGVLEGGGHASL